eukprot:comp12080_c0_seq1/m.6813 comp12080_c0_seq1/g.6813  ORF comp12080_c0_seq1/g.6813 comp12080_c0_seq1/m.6813 type:complete len:515 (-) comp12080_c0_seq1:632-2176(-)
MERNETGGFVLDSDSVDVINVDDYGKYTLSLDRPIYYDNDVVKGTLICNMQKPLSCKRLRARIVSVYSLRVADTAIKTDILWEAETTLTTNMILLPPSGTENMPPSQAARNETEGAETPGVYNFDFLFHLDSNMPNTLRTETLTCGTLAVRISYYAEVWYESDKPGSSKGRHTVGCVLMASRRFVKGAVYVPQPEVRPQASLSKTLAMSGLFGGQKESVSVTATLSKDVYSCGEPIVVMLDVDDQSENVWQVSACIRQKFGDLPTSQSPPINTVETTKPISRKAGVSKYKLLVDAVMHTCSCMDRKCDLPGCLEIAHVPADSHGNAATLVPTTIIDQSNAPARTEEEDVVGHSVIEYVIEVKVSIRKSRPMYLCLGFVMTNDTLVYTMNNPSCNQSPGDVTAAAEEKVIKRRVSESRAATWVMPTPFIRDGLPSYEQAGTEGVVGGFMKWFGFAQTAAIAGANDSSENKLKDEEGCGAPPSYDEIEWYSVLPVLGKETANVAVYAPVALSAGGM